MLKIESDRLYFRNLTISDVTKNYIEWLNDPLINQYLEIRFSQQNYATCQNFVQNINNDPNSHLLGIFDKSSQQHIGNIKLGPINPNHMSAQLSLFIGERKFWGKGLATEAIATITDWGFGQLNLERIEAGCYDANLASLKAFLNAGYTSEGYFRKKVIHQEKRIGTFWLSILKEENNHVS